MISIKYCRRPAHQQCVDWWRQQETAENLCPADVQFIDDRHQVAHFLCWRRNDQRVGHEVCPDDYWCVAGTGLRRTTCPLRPGCSDLLLQFSREFLGIGVEQVTYSRVTAFRQWRIQADDQGTCFQPFLAVATNQHTVGALVGGNI